MKRESTTKYIELPGFPPVPFIFIPETGVKRTIVVYGDSFAEAALHNAKGQSRKHPRNNTVNSWMWYLASFLHAKIITYGASAGSEQLTYDLFCKTQDVQRDATIIYHTCSVREDDCFNLPWLKKSDYTDWDKKIIEPCVHLYWTDRLYSFKNGSSFSTKYHLSHCSDPNVVESEILVPNVDESLLHLGANHSNPKGNLLLAFELTRYFKNRLEWETVF